MATVLISRAYAEMLEQQKRRKKQAKKARRHTIKVRKYDPTVGYEVLTEVETSDHGTFTEMWKKYGNEYRYYCAQCYDFPLYPDPDEGRKKKGTRQKRKFQRFDWMKGGTLVESESEQPVWEMQTNCLAMYGTHTAWIDEQKGIIWVERAPYIEEAERVRYEQNLMDLVELLKELPVEKLDGHLNYLVTSLFKRMYKPKYFNYNRAMGVLECIKQEFYRRVVGPYEDKKIKENGDV